LLGGSKGGGGGGRDERIDWKRTGKERTRAYPIWVGRRSAEKARDAAAQVLSCFKTSCLWESRTKKRHLIKTRHDQALRRIAKKPRPSYRESLQGDRVRIED